jgi:hypothetical protein
LKYKVKRPAVEGRVALRRQEAEMSDETSIDSGMGAAEAAAIMREQDQRARQAFQVSYRGSFVAWGAITLVGYGVTWLAVRGAHPAQGPNPIGFALVSVLGVASALAGRAEGRSDAGVGGATVWRRRVHVLALVVGLVAMYTLEGALYRAGAGRPVLFVFEATAPILVAGLFYLTSSALWLNWPLAGFGLWLAMAAVGGAFAGPQGVWGVDALTAGLGFLLMAALEPRLRRTAGLGLHQ